MSLIRAERVSSLDKLTSAVFNFSDESEYLRLSD